ncbi:hypothetical protein IJH02_03920 [Candidatus Saccharibacteria bacterium]|nr:hypothetical protein [Candidatus Saccharibacteria bacterium]
MNDKISWEAQEYVQRSKNAGWYVGLVFIGLALAAGALFLGWWSFAILIVVSVFALIVYTVRPPRVLKYTLSDRGLAEGSRIYEYKNYKSFGVLKDGEHFAIVLTPRKRFSGRVTVYFPENQGEAIVDAFGARLPMEEVKLDFIDKLIKFLRI